MHTWATREAGGIPTAAWKADTTNGAKGTRRQAALQVFFWMAPPTSARNAHRVSTTTRLQLERDELLMPLLDARIADHLG